MKTSPTSQTSPGSLCIVLHSHLPYVIGHGQWPHGTDWLNEAAAETYLPILEACGRCVRDGISPRLTIGVTPVLGEMLRHPAFPDQFREYLLQKQTAAEADAADFRATGRKDLLPVAEFWAGFYRNTREVFEGKYNRDIVSGFKQLQDGGHIEIITCAATHGYLPLLSCDESIRAQLHAGVSTTERLFGKHPRGIWLPECAYRPGYEWAPPLVEDAPRRWRDGIEKYLSEEHIDWFIVDSHLLRGGKAAGVYIDRFEALRRLWQQYESSLEPRPEKMELTPHELHLLDAGEHRKPVAIVTRDPETGVQVWSGEHGYPGDGNYLDFHKKHWPGGHRYWRVTRAKSDLAEKEIYVPEKALERLAPHADHFTGLCAEALNNHYANRKTPGILCSPYDAELFGHWWFEGPLWLEAVIRSAHRKGLSMSTVSDHLDANPPARIVTLPEGSWGQGGYHYIWLNEWTDWTWKHIYECEPEMVALAKSHANTSDPLLQRILKQAARETLLLQASDWQFLISTWSARDYAEIRFTFHVEAFRSLAKMARRRIAGESLSPEDERLLERLEKQDSLFADVDAGWWAGQETGH